MFGNERPVYESPLRSAVLVFVATVVAVPVVFGIISLVDDVALWVGQFLLLVVVGGLASVVLFLSGYTAYTGKGISAGLLQPVALVVALVAAGWVGDTVFDAFDVVVADSPYVVVTASVVAAIVLLGTVSTVVGTICRLAFTPSTGDVAEASDA